MFLRIALVLILLLSFVACSGKTSGKGSNIKSVERPSFIYNPSINGKAGGVGVSKPHIRGISAQRDLAISRAIDEIARQKGTTVQSWQKIESSGTKDSASSHMESISIQTSSGETIRANIRQLWEDPVSKELYVWMLSE